MYNPFGEEERLLFNFGSGADLQRWNVFSDSQYGGHSAAALKLSTEHKVRRWPAAVNSVIICHSTLGQGTPPESATTKPSSGNHKTL